MRRLFLLACGAALGACDSSSAPSAQPPSAQAPSGAALFERHCASCHGAEGRGDGPLASALSRPPADLTAIQVRGGGRFDEGDVMAVIDGRRSVGAHGPREMPVWGAVFEDELRGEGAPYAGITALQQKRELAEYLRSIQQPGEAAAPNG
jgi:mono/diheme cytochrome c family protein